LQPLNLHVNDQREQKQEIGNWSAALEKTQCQTKHWLLMIKNERVSVVEGQTDRPVGLLWGFVEIFCRIGITGTDVISGDG
jgi:hypothetical protein